MVVLSTDRSGCGIRLCGRSENSPRTVKIASVSSRASSTYWPLATCTTLLSPLGVASPETTCCTACCRSSRCLSLSGLARSSTRAGPASVSRAGGAPHAVAGTAANNAAPTTTLTALLTDALLRSEEAALPLGAGPPMVTYRQLSVTVSECDGLVHSRDRASTQPTARTAERPERPPAPPRGCGTGPVV